MVYLDYLLYIVVIVLFYILMEKILYNENKEGFEHRGKSFIAGKPKKVENEDEEKADSDWIITMKTFYRIAEAVAVMFIKMPYQILSKGVDIVIGLINEMSAILKPIYNFIGQMGKIVQKIATQIYNIIKRLFQKAFDIMRNLPAFIQKNASIAIEFISTMLNKMIDMLTRFFEMFQDILNQLLEIPNQIFNIVEQISTLMFNMFTMLMQLPEKGLNMMIGFQTTFMDMMDRPLKVPFSDQFLG